MGRARRGTSSMEPGHMSAGRHERSRHRPRSPRAQASPTRPVLLGLHRNAIARQGRLDDGVDLFSKPYSRRALAAKLRKVLQAE